jgi:histidine triad (HIT) family protein
VIRGWWDRRQYAAINRLSRITGRFYDANAILTPEPAMTDPTANCLFCRILRAEIPAKKVYENEHVFAFEDIDPKAPTHVLVIPKKHFAGLKEAQAEDADVIGRCHLAAADIARQRKIENGYRTVLNVGPGAGQSVFHLHVHLLGGRALSWPPG